MVFATPTLTIPALSLVVLIGPSGSGKSTFAQRHFAATEILSSDACRAMVDDDENSLDATADAFEVLHHIARTRLRRGRLTVIDATNVQPEARAPLVRLAREQHVLPVAIVLDLPERVVLDRSRTRTDRHVPDHAVRRQHRELRRTLRGLGREGFRTVHHLRSQDEIDAAMIERQPLWTDRRADHGPFDIIGDIHGCFVELRELLGKLGYTVSEQTDPDGGTGYQVEPPVGRRAIFLGDIVDRGPMTPQSLRLVMGMVEAGTALCVPGNHDDKLMRKLRGRNVRIAYGLAESLAQMVAEPPGFAERVADFLDGLISHYVLDGGNLVVAHAGMIEPYQGRASKTVRDFALYGETTGEQDERGLPVRVDWAAKYRGKAAVVYGHTPVVEPVWHNNTINIDTGCVFGGRLTALRWPERELVSVPAGHVYAESGRPFSASAEPAALNDARPAATWTDSLLDLGDVLGKRSVETRLAGAVTIKEANATAALEVISRWAVDPAWLIYLPPTISPPETSRRPDLLEHPAEAFAAYGRQGVSHLVAETKHMGSRAIVVICRDAAVAERRFGAASGHRGIIYTRTGRPFFSDDRLAAELLATAGAAVERAGLWEALATDWLCLDAEVMPWSVKAADLVRDQYAAVAAAGRIALRETEAAVAVAAKRDPELIGWRDELGERRQLIERYAGAYRHYSWPVNGLADLRVAPFHLLASEGAVHIDKSHVWHMRTLANLAGADASGVLVATAWREIDLGDEASQQAAIAWWEAMTSEGGEGIVIKPVDFVDPTRRRLAQPAIKCRGREYLRIVYGPEYTRPALIERLRDRSLGRKRSLAIREFALGIEGLERFVRGEPLYRVHECAFAVLALESEPVDPRL